MKISPEVFFLGITRLCEGIASYSRTAQNMSNMMTEKKRDVINMQGNDQINPFSDRENRSIISL